MSVPTLTGTTSGNSYEYDMLPYDQQRVLPAISNYRYQTNSSVRSSSSVEFQWEEVYLEETDTGIGYSMPIGYVIQMTPDIGLGSAMNCFTKNNPFLKQTDLLSIENGILNAEDNGSVIATLDASVYKGLLHSSPSDKYYWRAVAVGEDGSYGELGYPVQFYYRKSIIDNEWSITSDYTIVNKPNIYLLGKKSIDISDIEINDSLNVATFPDKDTWQININLVPGKNEFYLRAKDLVNNYSQYKKITILYEQADSIPVNIWNHFDEFGLILGLSRIPGEDNYKFKKRILDVAINIPGNQYNGIINGAIRETASTRINDAIKLRLYNKFPNTDYPIFIVDSAAILIEHSAFYIESEPHIVNPFTKSFNLNFPISDDSLIVVRINNLQIPREHYKIDYINNEISLNDGYEGKIIFVSYNYYQEIKYADYPTIADIVIKLNELTYDSINRIFIAEISEHLTGSEPSEHLILTSRILLKTSFSIEWSELMLREIDDKHWKFSLVNNRGTYFGTKWLGFVKQMKSLSRAAWEYVVTDISTWDNGIVNNEPQAFVRRQYDTYIGAFSNGIDETKYDSSRAYALGYINPFDGTLIKWNGPSKWKSGIGYDDDLYVTLKKLEKPKFINDNVMIYITNKSNIVED